MTQWKICTALALAALSLVAQAQATQELSASTSASVAMTDMDPNQHMACTAPAEAARVGELRTLSDGRLAFKVSTFSQTYAGIADPLSPQQSMAKQVVALQGKRFFCLHD